MLLEEEMNVKVLFLPDGNDPDSFALGRSLRSRTLGAPGFHGLTGGVYKARERIHRAMADARLLAIPTSCRRVAACNLN